MVPPAPGPDTARGGAGRGDGQGMVLLDMACYPTCERAKDERYHREADLKSPIAPDCPAGARVVVGEFLEVVSPSRHEGISVHGSALHVRGDHPFVGQLLDAVVVRARPSRAFEHVEDVLAHVTAILFHPDELVQKVRGLAVESFHEHFPSLSRQAEFCMTRLQCTVREAETDLKINHV